MKLPAHEHLDRLGIAYEVAEFPPSTEKGAASVAHALGFREAQMVKTLVFETGTGERVLVMVPADRSAISGHLKRVLGSRNVRLASPDAVKQTSGYEIGSVPPFHWQPPGFRSLLDAALLREERLGVGAGVWGHEILLTPQALVQASRAQVVNLTDASLPVLVE
jgi:Cys-tRNA(Pro)/Cys-tRNA(Cys) deacylase